MEELYECRILLVDDELELLQANQKYLQLAGFINIDIAQNAASANMLFLQNHYHLILLDVMLPDMDGFALLEMWNKGKNGHPPVIFLSAKDEDYHRLMGLGLGADDYITKPYLPEELLLRMKAVLRRTYHFERNQHLLQLGETVIDFQTGIIKKNDQTSELTAKEFYLLKKLYENANRIVSINQLIQQVWQDGSFGYENALMVHIRRLREKIEDNPSSPKYILTVRGLGYKLLVEDQK